MKVWMAFISLMILTGCSLTPELKKPEIDLPSTLRPEWKVSEAELVNREWWKEFNDPVLDSLIEEAIKSNDDLLIAATRIQEAGAILGISRAELYPLISAGASISGSRSSEEVKNSGDTTSTYSISAMASYEIDLWGKMRNKKRADLMRLLATKSSRDSLEISIISAVASTYFNLISIEKQINTAEEILNRQYEIYEFRQKQFRHGIIDELVLEQSKAEFESTRLLLETLKTQRENLKSSLTVLLGRSPKEIFEGKLNSAVDLPEPIRLPEMAPSELLLHRPDIIEAEENLKAANLEIGVARAAYFPSITLTGSGGLRSNELSNLIQSSALFWDIGANIAGTILDFGRKKAIVKLREAQKEEALIQYVRTVRIAFKEVFDAITNLEQSLKRLDTQKAQLSSLEKVVALAEKKFERGLVDYLVVLDSQRGYLNARLNLIRIQAEVINNHVFLYKAIGGNGQERQKEIG